MNPANRPRVLALETSALQGSIALAEVGRQLACHILTTKPLPEGERSARSLAPAIAALLEQAGWAPESIDRVAVSSGPGSFTGLRIGVTTAKVLAWAIGAQVAGINTLEALAHAEMLSEGSRPRKLWAVMDAQRGELFVASFPTPQTKTRVVRLAKDAFLEQLAPGDEVVGPAASCVQIEGVLARKTTPTAESVAKLAVASWSQAEQDDCYQLMPEYHRASAAEENYERQSKSCD